MMASTALAQELWRHPAPETTALDKFRRKVNKKRGLNLQTFQDVHEYSVTRSEFWDDIWEQAPFIYEGKYDIPCDFKARMDSIPKWFQGVYFNHAESILFSPDPRNHTIRTTINKEDSKIAVTEIREGGTDIKQFTWKELRALVGQYASALRNLGFKSGDRIAACASNQFVSLVIFLATTTLGGIFSSSATDLGTKGILERITQVEPVYLFMDDWALFNGSKLDLRHKLKDVLKGMEGVKNFKGAVLIPRFGANTLAGFEGIPNIQTLSSFLSYSTTSELSFVRFPFGHPVGIVYTSGTTGQPKCIVHNGGGVLLMAYIQQVLHSSTGPSDTLLQYTTIGWIMYYFCIQYLLMGGHTILYDGSPFRNKLTDFIKLIGDQGVTQLGISPRYLQELQNNKLRPKEITDCSKLRIVTCSGMVLSSNLFLWFYNEGFPSHVQLANVTGGTDVAACFALNNPLTPIYPMGCQGLSLGVKIEVFDDTIYEEGGPTVKGVCLPHGKPGELVCTRAFPSMPNAFWGTGGDRKYYEAYFSKYDDVWTHGDFVSLVPLPNALHLAVHGRSDGVLNPSGVRFGSSEIYTVLESPPLNKLVLDSLVIGQFRPQDRNEHLVLFLMLRPSVKLSRELANDVKAAIAKALSKRHVPQYVFEVPLGGIPTTINGKRVENIVKKVLCGKKVTPSQTIANPECIAFYYNYVQVEDRQKELERMWRAVETGERANL